MIRFLDFEKPITFKIEVTLEKDLTVIIGENGSGKTFFNYLTWFDAYIENMLAVYKSLETAPAKEDVEKIIADQLPLIFSADTKGMIENDYGIYSFEIDLISKKSKFVFEDDTMYTWIDRAKFTNLIYLTKRIRSFTTLEQIIMILKQIDEDLYEGVVYGSEEALSKALQNPEVDKRLKEYMPRIFNLPELYTFVHVIRNIEKYNTLIRELTILSQGEIKNTLCYTIQLQNDQFVLTDVRDGKKLLPHALPAGIEQLIFLLIGSTMQNLNAQQFKNIFN